MAAEVAARQPAVIVFEHPCGAGAPRPRPQQFRLSSRPASDPVRDGLVTTLSRPGGNVTGVVFITGTLGRGSDWSCCASSCRKRRRLPCWSTPAGQQNRGRRQRDVLGAASRAIGQRLHHRRSQQATATSRRRSQRLVQRGADALYIGTGAVLTFNNRETDRRAGGPPCNPHHVQARATIATAGGLMSYGASITDAFRQAGLYAQENSQRREAGRPAGYAVQQIRARDQPQDRKDPRPRISSATPRHRRRGDRMTRGSDRVRIGAA